MSSKKILIIDDEYGMRELLRIVFKNENYYTKTAGTGQESLVLLKQETFDIIIQDMMLPDISGIKLLSQIKKLYPRTIVIIITAVAGWQTAVEAMRIGAFDYIKKPFDNNNIKSVVNRGIKYKIIQDSMPKKERVEIQNIIGNSRKIQDIQELIRRAAPTDSTIMIYGESGTGKELVARAIHRNSLRRENVFIPVNCAAIAENIIESELFGHMKGSFTHAISDKKGLFEISDNGTLFFDEIGELNVQTQVKLLRVIEYREFMPVGGTQSRQIDVRFIAATNQDLEKNVEKGEFREDLFYRLNVIPIYVPPLRDRKEDIPLLAGHFLAINAARMHKHVVKFSDDVMELLLNYEWTGNIRELSNLIQRAVVLCEGDTITKKDLGNYIKLENSTLNNVNPPLPEGGINIEEKLKQVEQYYIKEALKSSKGNLTEAAKLLKLSFRSFRYKVKKYGINSSEFS